MESLLRQIKNCTICSEHLPLGPNPVMTASPTSKIIIIGQAPGRIVHETGIPWNDKSGDNLRSWMGIGKDEFYNTTKIALVPMGFCFPGTGKSGDLPPRKECAPEWHQSVFKNIKKIELTLLVGKYALDYYLPELKGQSLTQTVKDFKIHLPKFLALPHPSPRNNIWQARNPWFQETVLPELKAIVSKIVNH